MSLHALDRTEPIIANGFIDNMRWGFGDLVGPGRAETRCNNVH
jgi:hypothetical protein